MKDCLGDKIRLDRDRNKADVIYRPGTVLIWSEQGLQLMGTINAVEGTFLIRTENKTS